MVWHFVFSILLGVGLLFLVTAYFYGLFSRRERDGDTYALPVKEGETALDRAVAQLALTGGGVGLDKNGLSLIDGNLDAFAARVLCARLAERSLDMMYYIWHDDLTGRLLLNEVLDAADRGVRVRLLLDDINAQGRDPAYVALDQHPNIKIRMFNPSRTRHNGLRRGLEMVLRVLTVTRRMHNKAFIADGRVAIVGGRNIGDAYFGAGKMSNFRDLDLALVGPSVREAEVVFDNFWNSDMALPIRVLALPRRLKNPDTWRDELARFYLSWEARPFLDYLHQHIGIEQLPRNTRRFSHKNVGKSKKIERFSESKKLKMALERLLDVESRLFVADKVKVLSDPPQKALNRRSENWLMGQLLPKLEAAKKSLQLTSPYFVPGLDGTARLIHIAREGVRVKVLTNSLAATDVAAVHGGYMPYRKILLKGGIELYELKRDGSKQRLRLFGSGRASLHTKAFLVDETQGFVGSFNFDPRSVSLNTEMGILFECAGISSKMAALFEEEITGQMSYHVVMENGEKLTWHSINEQGEPVTLYQEPETRWGRRAFVRLISLLPIESQL